jgi:hypothetical protein
MIDHGQITIGDKLTNPSLLDIWELDGRIASIETTIQEAQDQAAAPYLEELESLRAIRKDLFTAAAARGAAREVYPFGTLSIYTPSKLSPRSIDPLEFMRAHPEHIDRCISSRVIIGEAQKVLSEAEFLALLQPREHIYGEPVLKLAPPPAPKVLPGTAAPKRRKSDIIRERSEP